MSDPFLAEIKMFAGNYAPRNWALCDGQEMPITQNQALFALINTYYGGDGRVTMGLPDLRGRVPIHAGYGPGRTRRQLGEWGGYETVNLSVGQMPTHNHTATSELISKTPVTLSKGDTDTPSEDNTSILTGELKAGRSILNGYTNGTPTNTLQPLPVEGTMVINDNGGNLPHENMQPFLTLNFIIALDGLFPPRS